MKSPLSHHPKYCLVNRYPYHSFSSPLSSRISMGTVSYTGFHWVTSHESDMPVEAASITRFFCISQPWIGSISSIASPCQIHVRVRVIWNLMFILYLAISGIILVVSNSNFALSFTIFIYPNSPHPWPPRQIPRWAVIWTWYGDVWCMLLCQLSCHYVNYLLSPCP